MSTPTPTKRLSSDARLAAQAALVHMNKVHDSLKGIDLRTLDADTRGEVRALREQSWDHVQRVKTILK